ncbi:fimbria/pilus outer membrane usher protein [Citrobacter koseri]|uniref:fimbria/pilus outer membrane usher protein n=1 Tax=Citrobacter koseri TaxID=545 RepID=UPI0018E177AA|nr:fimbria/pilus outer membrane usher protein [Citrobacter koseri]MBI0676608.1 fimbria/pilus outer membrane usher protein [Citrobacter koseri]
MRISLLTLSVCIACSSGSVYARSYTFDPTMLGLSGDKVDMSLINQGGQLPGTYPVDVIINGDRVDSRDVTFKPRKNDAGGIGLEPCLSVEQLSLYGVNVEKYPALSASAKEGGCARLAAIPDAKADFQFYNQQLLLSVPQVAMRPKLSGIAPQQLWDDGIPALLMGYNANINRTENRGNSGGNESNNSSYVQLNPGANLGPWRLRNQTNWSKQSNDDEGKWQTVYTYAERGLYDMKSRLTLGDRSTPDDVFDSVPFRGVMLGSDDNMVPYNQREYAPVIRGIARTQARVEVKQNGYTVYSQTVAPGPFALTDLNVSGGDTGGDLQVTVWETDGSPQVFTVPFQSPAIALHEGYLKYNVMTGRYRPASSGVGDTVGQATVMYGLPWNLTVYGGAQAADHYQSAALGLGLSMGEWGAVSLDGSGSHGQRQNQDTENGAAWRIRYSKDVAATDTTLTMTSYQYASAGYNTLSDVLDTWGSNDNDSTEWFTGNSPYDRRKSTSSVTLSQSTRNWGYLNLNGSRTDYWNRPGHDDSYGVSYGFSVYGASVSLGLTRNKQYNDNGDQRSDTISSLYVSVPLDRLLRTGSSSLNATYQMNSSKDTTNNQAGLTGSSFDNQLSWDVSQSRRTGDSVSDSNNSAMHATWYGRYGQLGGNYSYSQHQRLMGASVSGGIVAHENGVTLGQSLGDTMALIEAPGAAGVPVTGFPGISTDFRGYTTKANLTPYQENTISLDPSALPPDAEISQTDTKVVPTQGAIVPAKFRTRVGGRALMTLSRADGEMVPFGSVVTLGQGDNSGAAAGIVGDKGLVYLTGLPPEGILVVREGEQSQCRVDYVLPDDKKDKNAAGLYTMAGTCK